MNALYRPGPMEYIPNFIARKHGREDINYDLPEMEEYLKDTYGITVYQEQVMLLSQKLANFSKGQADLLRKAMGKKLIDLLAKLKPQFLDGGESNGHAREVLEKIWKDWEAFASYAFNKSHSTCYAWIAYQTAYLKAHYPAEYMAAVLSNNMNDIKQVSFFMEECKRMKLNVLGPDVNESYFKFSVNKDNAVRFGMGAVKGVGQGAVETIVENRKKDGPYKSIFDLTKRVDLRAANKRALESLAYAGGFDCFTDTHRAQYFGHDGDGINFLEKAIKYGSKHQENENSAQVSLFGDASDIQIPEPKVPPCEEWGTMEKLKREREVVGIYISGHPLDDFKVEMNTFCNARLSMLNHLDKFINRELTFGGVVSEVQHRTTKAGKGWATFILEDYNDSFEFRIYGEEYLKFRHFLVINSFVHVRIMVREGWANKETGAKGEPRVQFLNFLLLHDVMEQFAKKLTLQLELNEISKHRIEVLESIFKSHQGKNALNFVVYDNEEKIKLNLPSQKVKVNITQELISMLEEQSLVYKLN
jgi:DNA polymerase-3 subunit alpha